MNTAEELKKPDLPEDVFTWKKVAGREKDLRDLKLIESYRANLST